MLSYNGPLYGKIGRKCFDTGRTSADWDAMERAIMAFLNCASEQPAMDGNPVISGWNPMKLNKAYQNAVDCLNSIKSAP